MLNSATVLHRHRRKLALSITNEPPVVSYILFPSTLCDMFFLAQSHLCRANEVNVVTIHGGFVRKHFCTKKGWSHREGGLMARNIVVLSPSHIDLGEEGVKILEDLPEQIPFWDIWLKLTLCLYCLCRSSFMSHIFTATLVSHKKMCIVGRAG